MNALLAFLFVLPSFLGYTQTPEGYKQRVGKHLLVVFPSPPQPDRQPGLGVSYVAATPKGSLSAGESTSIPTTQLKADHQRVKDKAFYEEMIRSMTDLTGIEPVEQEIIQVGGHKGVYCKTVFPREGDKVIIALFQMYMFEDVFYTITYSYEGNAEGVEYDKNTFLSTVQLADKE